MKKTILILTVVIALVAATTSVAFAYDGGRSCGNMTANQSAVCGAQSTDAATQEQFKEDRLTQCKENLDQRVAQGTLSQEEADEIYAACTNNACNQSANYTNKGTCSQSGTCTNEGTCSQSGICTGANQAENANGNGNRGRGCGMMS